MGPNVKRDREGLYIEFLVAPLSQH